MKKVFIQIFVLGCLIFNLVLIILFQVLNQNEIIIMEQSEKNVVMFILIGISFFIFCTFSMISLRYIKLSNPKEKEIKLTVKEGHNQLNKTDIENINVIKEIKLNVLLSSFGNREFYTNNYRIASLVLNEYGDTEIGMINTVFIYILIKKDGNLQSLKFVQKIVDDWILSGIKTTEKSYIFNMKSLLKANNIILQGNKSRYNDKI